MTKAPISGRPLNDDNVHAPQRLELPSLTALQFCVMSSLASHDERSGRDLRGWLGDNGIKSSGPQFYQMMARLEDAGYVEGWYAQKQIEHQVVNERRYRVTNQGLSAWNDTRDFYSHLGQRSSAKKTTAPKRKPRREMAHA